MSAPTRYVAILTVAISTMMSLGRNGHAHRFRPDVIALKERAPGVFVVQTSPPVEGEAARPEPAWPARCERTEKELRCPTEEALPEEMSLGGAELPREVLVLVELLDGQVRSAATPAGARSLNLPALATRATRRPGGASVAGFVPMGVWHILYGADHLLFVLGLILIAGSLRRLVGSITAFTIGHSVTLALAALGVVSIPQTPVEALIAVSLALIALEVVRPRAEAGSWAVVPAAFGLVHGLGFASALDTSGLSRAELPLALFGFNVGVELGQLAFVLAVLTLTRAARLHRGAIAARVAGYAIGSAGVWLALGRIVSFWSRT